MGEWVCVREREREIWRGKRLFEHKFVPPPPPSLTTRHRRDFVVLLVVDVDHLHHVSIAFVRMTGKLEYLFKNSDIVRVLASTLGT